LSGLREFNIAIIALTQKAEVAVAYPGILFGEVQQIQLRTENGGVGAVVPYP
jgi:hypothetical protein